MIGMSSRWAHFLNCLIAIPNGSFKFQKFQCLDGERVHPCRTTCDAMTMAMTFKETILHFPFNFYASLQKKKYANFTSNLIDHEFSMVTGVSEIKN